MYYTIYKITNKLNGKFYIGKHQTKNLDDGYMGSGKLIRAAIKKYGLKNFEKEILHIFETEAEMNEAEANLVVIGEDSYNLCRGGQGGFGYINENGLSVLNRLTIEQQTRRKKARSSSRKKMIEMGDPNWQRVQLLAKEATKEKYPNGVWYGKRHSDDTKIKMSDKAKQRTPEQNSQHGTCWIHNGVENKKIKKEMVDFYVNLGYTKGRII